MLFSLLVQLNDVATMAPLLMFAQFAMTCALVLIITNGDCLICAICLPCTCHMTVVCLL